MQGTNGYMAPEVASEQRLSFASDVFSFGVLLFELYSGRCVSSSIRSDHVPRFALHSWRPTLPDGCPMAYSELAARCWNADPHLRPTLDTVIEELTKIANLN